MNKNQTERIRHTSASTLTNLQFFHNNSTKITPKYPYRIPCGRVLVPAMEEYSSVHWNPGSYRSHQWVPTPDHARSRVQMTLKNNKRTKMVLGLLPSNYSMNLRWIRGSSSLIKVIFTQKSVYTRKTLLVLMKIEEKSNGLFTTSLCSKIEF